MYTSDAKYSKSNDSLSFKLTIFYDMYAKAKILPSAYFTALLTMLTGIALLLFYGSKSTIPNTFGDIVKHFKSFFKG